MSWEYLSREGEYALDNGDKTFDVLATWEVLDESFLVHYKGIEADSGTEAEEATRDIQVDEGEILEFSSREEFVDYMKDNYDINEV